MGGLRDMAARYGFCATTTEVEGQAAERTGLIQAIINGTFATGVHSREVIRIGTGQLTRELSGKSLAALREIAGGDKADIRSFFPNGPVVK